MINKCTNCGEVLNLIKHGYICYNSACDQDELIKFSLYEKIVRSDTFGMTMYVCIRLMVYTAMSTLEYINS